MKNFIFLLTVFFVCNLNSQNSSALIVYKKEIKTNSLKTKNKSNQKRVNDIFSEMDKNKDKLEYFLKINGTKSEFSFNERLFFNEVNSNYLVGAGDTKGVFYTDLNLRTIIRSTEFSDQKFNIKYKIDSLHWKLKQEFKFIGGYKCFKAETFKVIKNDKGTSNHLVVAWYAPSIPLTFGPINYCGLPGLILEISYQNIKFKALKINLNIKNEIKISKIKKGKEVTFNEFNAIVKELVKQYRKGW